MEVGLVHDYLLVMRGAERTFACIADSWPEAPIYTTLYDVRGTEGRFAGRSVRSSFLQRSKVWQGSFRKLLPLYPAAVARLPVGRHDVVVSSSSAFAHGVRARPDAIHVCYCHSPFRYAWHERARALEEVPRALKPATAATLERIRRWDLRAAARVTRYVANSEITRRRIGDFYGRDAAVIHPPVETHRFDSPVEPEDWFLVVCELVAHKRVSLALEAARRAGVRVKVVGDGPERASLEARYGDVAEFAGRVDDRALERLYSRALALVVPNVEEFGIAAVEAQAAGRPVLAADAGGTRETVVPGSTGELVPQTVSAFAEAMRQVDFTRYEPAAMRENAERFSVERFGRELRSEVELAVTGRPAAVHA